MTKWNANLAIGGLLALAALGSAQVVKEQGFLPFGGAPIHYRTSKGLVDPVAKLQQRLDSGEAVLRHEAANGYLRSVLEALRIPVSSQTLVFSKTSFQYPYINPQSPRALYFNDDVYVGQVHGSKALEFVSFDPAQGAIFYILNEQKVERPRFERAQLDCVQCHVHNSTRSVPGVMVRSVVTNPTGYPKAGARVFTTGHESPLAERWEGWYVTGGPEGKSPEGHVDLSRYLVPTSDVVAHLVLAHQTQMHNYVTETNYRFRLGQSIEAPVEALVRYLLFANEAPLALPPAAKQSRFAAEFAALGPRDAQGRSLRDFDLDKRIFKYPCSYLIYSEAFDAIPAPAKAQVYRRLWEVLSGQDRSPDFAALSDADRRAILEILVATKPGLPSDWTVLSKL